MTHASKIVGVATALLLAACGDTPPSKSDPARAAAEAAARQAFAHSERAWRAQRHADLVAPDGWTTLIGLHWIERGPHYVGSERDNGIRIAAGPPQLGLLTLERDGALRLVPARGAGLSLDDKPLAAPTALRADTHADGPSKVGFDAGKGVATVIERGGRHALRVRHADAPTRTGFTGVRYWPAEREWRIAGRFVPHPAGRTLEVADIVGTVQAMPNPGRVEFEHAGKTYRLEALDGDDGALFLVFADTGNGRRQGGGSYAAGRFLDVDKPDAQRRVAIDFNRAYNPPCAFTAYATCPLPPAQNRLDFLVDAGEQAYAPKP